LALPFVNGDGWQRVQLEVGSAGGDHALGGRVSVGGLARSRPKTALFRDFVVSLRISLCDVRQHVSAEILAFLELAKNVSFSPRERASSHPEFPDGN
jgi:hypothetical protein